MAALLLAALLWAVPARAAVLYLPQGGSVLPVLAPVSLTLDASALSPRLQSSLSVSALTPSLPLTASPLLAPSVLPLAAPAAPQAVPRARDSLTAAAAAVAPSADRSRDSGAALRGFWDGAPGRPAAVSALPAALAAKGTAARSKDGVPWDAATRAQGADLDRIMAAARQSPTAARILDSMERLHQATGKAVPVRFAALGNNLGEYDYLRGILFLDDRYRRGDPRQAAATLAHELLHILQHAQKVPSEALEMELEAHVVSLRILDELGVPDGERDGFSRAAVQHLRISPADFIAWMRTQLPGKIDLAAADFPGLAGELADDIDQTRDRIEDLEERLAEKDSPRLRARIEREHALLATMLRDLKFLRSPAGRKRCGKFSRRARAAVRSYHLELLRGDP